MGFDPPLKSFDGDGGIFCVPHPARIAHDAIIANPLEITILLLFIGGHLLLVKLLLAFVAKLTGA